MNMDVKKVVGEVIGKVKPDEKLMKELWVETKNLKSLIEKGIKKRKVKADVFLGGSFAKGTMIKKNKYDVDVYVRFKDGKKDISEELGKILVKAEKIHGSRDYFRIQKGSATWEIIPILRISKPGEAKNITDLSPFHVTYIQSKIKKNKKLGDEILLAKAFCYAQEVYGAESYIHGISGYGVELLLCYYQSFMKMIRTMGEAEERIIIDGEKQYKNKNEILNSVNEAKLQSPIVLIDPTFRERNALAALSKETYEKFRNSCREFLKNPSLSFFERKSFDENEFRKGNGEFVKVVSKTNKQKGDIAGSKLFKFHRFLRGSAEKYFSILKDQFVYDDKQKGESYFMLEKKGEIILSGPPIVSIENVARFKKKHKNCYVEEGKVYAKESGKSWNTFFKEFKDKNKVSIKSMGIKLD